MREDDKNGLAPDGALAHAVRLMLRRLYSDLVFNHASRVFYFGSIVAARRGLKVDLDLLYVSAMFHTFGMSPGVIGSHCPMEIDGAKAAVRFLERFSVPADAREHVWDAVALSATPGISAHKSNLARALMYGVETDLLGMHFCEVTAAQRHRAVNRFPREIDFADKIIDAMGAALRNRPETAFGTLYADILERTDPTYRRPNFCGKILGSDWTFDA